MIEIDDKAIQQYVYFPQNSNVEADSYSLVLHSELTQLDIEFTGLTDESKSKNYFKFLIDASQVDDGEYNYSIKANGDIVATGLIKIGEVTDDIPETHVYDSSIEEDEVIQYYPTGNYKYRFQSNKIVEITSNGIYNVKPDSGYTALLNVEVHADIIPNKQIKDIEIVENSTVKVTADEGYAALSEVNVTVDVPVDDYYQSGYTDGYTTGYTSGKTDGIIEQKAKLISTAVTTNGTYQKEDGYNEINVDVPVEDYYQSGYTDGVAEQKSKLISTAITTNGTYEREDGYNEITVNVPTGSTINNQTKSITATTNGSSAVTFDAGYTGLDKVNVNVNVPVQDYWNSGYTSGKTDGVAEQKAKLVSTAVTTNGTYQKEDGYSSITVNVPTGSTINNQTKTVNVNVNGTSAITYDVGYTGLERVNLNVNVPQTGHTDEELAQAYTSGITVGVAEQKAKLISTAVTTNGTYSRIDGYSSVNVNVPQTGHTDEELAQAYTSGYTYGFNTGYTSGCTDGYKDGVAEQKGKLVSTAITTNGTYSREDGYSSITVNVSTIQYHRLSVVPTSTETSGLTNRMQATVTQLGSATTKTYIGDGYTITFELLPGAEYTVSYNNVEGYNSPSPQSNSGVTTWSGQTLLTPWYEVSSGVPYEDQYLTLEIVSGGTLVGPYMNYQTSKIYYSINNGEWLQISDTTPINVSTGDKVRLKGKNQSVAVAASKSGFNGTSKYNLCGNIMSILYNDDFQNQTTLSGTNSFSRVFKNSQVIDAENLILPATTLTQACYQGMFSGCTTIVTAPSSLPAMTLTDACYDSMFRGCTSLVTAPALPATNIEINCYQYMFVGCSNLVNVPSVLPATTLKNYCYQNMFGDCTSLTTAPELPATALTHYCYNAMFFGCTSLNYIKCLAVNGINLNNSTSSWVFEVPSGGIFVKSVNAIDWPTTGDNGIPSGWTVEEV